MRTCPNCGHEMLNDNFAECPKCGFNLYSHNKKNNSLFSNINKKLPKSIGDISEQITTQVKKEEAYIKSRLDDDSTALVDDNEFFISKTVFDGVDYITNKKQEFEKGRASKNENKNTTSVKFDNNINQETKKPKKDISTKQKIDETNSNNLELSDLQETLINTLPLIDNPSEYEEDIIKKYSEYSSEERKELLKDCWTITKLAEKHNIKRQEVEKAILTDEFLEKDLIGVFKVNPNNIRSLKILYRKPLTEIQQPQEIKQTKKEASTTETKNTKQTKTNKNDYKETKTSGKKRGLFGRKSPEQKEFEEKMDYYFGAGIFKDGYLVEQDKKNNRPVPTIKYSYMKDVLKKEFKDGKLQLNDVDERISELNSLDMESMKKDILFKDYDSSLIKTSDDLIKALDELFGKKNAYHTHCKEYRRLSLIEKYDIDLTDAYSFDCVIKADEIKNSFNLFTGTTSHTEKIHYPTLVLVYNEYMILLVEERSVLLGIHEKGMKKFYFKDIFDIQFINVNKLLNNSDTLYVDLFIHFKSSEKILLGVIRKEHADEFKNKFEKYVQENNIEVQDEQNNQQYSNADELLKYAELHKQGLLTDEEFEAKKKELL